MNTTLVIDRGNSTLKASLFQGNDCLRSCRFGHDSDVASAIAETAGDSCPQGAIYAYTSDNPEEDIRAIASALGFEPLVLTHATPLPIAIRYSSPLTLGLDRIAAAVAASHWLNSRSDDFDFVLIADAGTALTLDIADRAGFRGGNISAGLSMRLHALHSATSRLPLVEAEGDCPDFGYDTATAIRSGAFHGIAAEIEVSFEKASENYGKGAILLTGGDAAAISPFIDSSLNVVACPSLVADGLNRILHYNENVR